ncbi:hypothetical protein, partial [Methyloversatilis sp.]|uniref:hypothetical protein n=1 Tax=Methyloversatilis sp. TaxID=2569862 RepID=UPI0027346F40
AFPSLPTINPQLKPVRDNQMSGIINLPRHSSHPDCRARLIQIVALQAGFRRGLQPDATALGPMHGLTQMLIDAFAGDLSRRSALMP